MMDGIKTIDMPEELLEARDENGSSTVRRSAGGRSDQEADTSPLTGAAAG